MTQETQHTPGPWEHNCSGHVRRAGNENSLLAIIHHAGGKVKSDEQLANLKLMAAAPDLLEALEGAIEAWDADSAPNSWSYQDVEKARAAIQKARGQS